MGAIKRSLAIDPCSARRAAGSNRAVAKAWVTNVLQKKGVRKEAYPIPKQAVNPRQRGKALAGTTMIFLSLSCSMGYFFANAATSSTASVSRAASWASNLSWQWTTAAFR